MTAGRILVVDDERFFQEMFREILESAGHVTRTAASADEALRLMSEEHFDLLVTDIVMPGLDGIGLVKEVKKRDPSMEAIAVTGHEDVRLAVQAMKAGCADFLPKPVDRRELVVVADRALGRSRLRTEHTKLVTENQDLVRSQELDREGLKILATLDAEGVQELTLSVLARVTDAQGAALWLADEKGLLQLRGYRGVVDRAALPRTIDPEDPAWKGTLVAGAPFDAPGAVAGEAFMVPLVVDEEVEGLALLSDRSRGLFGGDEHAAAVSIVDFAAIAARNARRFHAIERVGLRERDTGAYNLAYFVDYAGKEFYKARRYGRAFSLAVVSIDNSEQMRRQGGRELYRRALRGVVAAVSRVMRDADILAKVNDGEYHVLLPETDHFGALMFLRRSFDEVRAEGAIAEMEQHCPVLVSMGASSFPKDGEDFDELLHHARARVEEQRGSLLRRLQLGDLDPSAFWEMVDLLLSASARIPDGSPSAKLDADPDLLGMVQREAAREIERDPRARGLLYVGVRGPLASAPLLSSLPQGDPAVRASDATTRVFLLGRRAAGATPAPHPLVTEVYLDGDQRFAGHDFLLFLSEHSAYGLLCGPDGTMFHTSDVPLVGALVSKLQSLYDLQPL